MKLVLAGVVGVCACVTDPISHYDRPARLEMGVNTRRFSAPVTDHVAQRGATATTPTMDTPLVDHSAVTGVAQFTMATPFHTYLGGEIEAGELEQPGSNLAAGYAVLGARSASHFGSLSVEL